MVILHREDVGNPVDFFAKTFPEYKAGFEANGELGELMISPTGELFYGLEKLHDLTRLNNNLFLKITMAHGLVISSCLQSPSFRDILLFVSFYILIFECSKVI